MFGFSNVLLNSGITSSGASPISIAEIVGASISDEFILLVKTATDIGSLSENKVNVYPNPSQGMFYIETDYYSKDLMIIIRDFNGRVIQRVKPVGKKTMVDISEFSSGMYFIELNDKVESKEFKINLNK